MGSVNLLAIEQYDEAASRLHSYRLMLRRSAIVEKSYLVQINWSKRRTRLTDVLDRVSANFSRVYRILQPGGAGDLRLENQTIHSLVVSRCGLSPGKSTKSNFIFYQAVKNRWPRSHLSLQYNFEPSPFYFDEVDQNLDSFNAESIAQLCRLRSERAQFLMVTLRKVSLQLLIITLA